MIQRLSFKQILAAGFLLFILAYALFQARFLIIGPRISVETPRNGDTVAGGPMTISGHARNISFISLNDRPIFLDEEGYWSEKLIAQRGLSIMTVKARDRFGRETAKVITILIN